MGRVHLFAKGMLDAVRLGLRDDAPFGGNLRVAFACFLQPRPRPLSFFVSRGDGEVVNERLEVDTRNESLSRQRKS